MENRTTETRRLAELTSHPRQQELVGDIPHAALLELARDLEERGQQHPIEILSDGLIISGHQRVRAAEMLGWEEIEVVVRDDFAGADDPDLLFHLVADNVMRRQMDPIALGRAYRLMKTIRLGGKGSSQGTAERLDTRDQIGKALGVAGRTLDRLEQLLGLPPAILDAISQKRLTQSIALRLTKLPRSQQAEIADAIAAGDQPRLVAEEYLSPPSQRQVKPIQEYRRFASEIERALRHLSLCVDEVVGSLLARHDVALLDRGIDLLQRLREREIAQELEDAALDYDSGDEVV